VKSSAELGLVKLLGESSIGAGVRRVEALVGFDAFHFLAKEHVLLNSLTEIIKGSRVEELPERISDLLERVKTVEKELATLKSAQALAGASALLEKAELIEGTTAIFEKLGDGISVDDLRTIALDLRNRNSNSVVGLLSLNGEKVTLVVAASDEARDRGAKAGDLVKLGSTVLGGGGGGKDDFAQGGGVNASNIADAIREMKAALRSSVGK
jgi:alanyl-tRNA synthetase